jgi:hypothetical protein
MNFIRSGLEAIMPLTDQLTVFDGIEGVTLVYCTSSLENKSIRFGVKLENDYMVDLLIEAGGLTPEEIREQARTRLIKFLEMINGNQ